MPECPKSQDPLGYHKYKVRFWTVGTTEYSQATCEYCEAKAPIESAPVDE